MLNIIGGTYVESCIEPQYKELYGSGLRAAIALSGKDFSILFNSCVGCDDEKIAQYKAKLFNFNCDFFILNRTVEFDYYHPLSPPVPLNLNNNIVQLQDITAENVLYYGMIEAKVKVSADYLVYDPQNHKSFKETESTAKHLALILNKKEALALSESNSSDLIEIGHSLLKTEKAEVVVIKNGPQGALVFEDGLVKEIPVFETKSVWPIGTGDIFSAVFAWKWIIEKNSSFDSAYQASKYVSQFCESPQFPLVLEKESYIELEKPKPNKLIYLAGPFFSFGQRFLINEFRIALIEFGNEVFSPYHDAGVLDDNCSISEIKDVAKLDLQNISNCDTLLAVLTGNDAGTLFEIGYARALNKKIILFSENMNRVDLTMFVGSDCEIIEDFSTAVYKASW
jgi:nucleoside 2-deoxyribosyltransferase